MSGAPRYKTRRCSKIKPAKSILSTKKARWSVSEMRSLANGLEKYGFGNLAKLAAAVGTRSEIEVRFFIEKWTDRVYRNNASVANGNQLHKLFSRKYKNPFDGNYDYPPIAVWKKVILNLMQPKFKGMDYSNMMVDLFRSFAEEEEQYQFEDFPNLKEVYEYFADTLEGNIPPVPCTMNNVILNYLFSDLKKFIQQHDFCDEKEFLTNFKGPHRFKPMCETKEDVKMVQKILCDENETGAQVNGNEHVQEAGPSSHDAQSDSFCVSASVINGPSTSCDSQGNENSISDKEFLVQMNSMNIADQSDSFDPRNVISNGAVPSISGSNVCSQDQADITNPSQPTIKVKLELVDSDVQESSEIDRQNFFSDVIVEGEYPPDLEYIPKGATVEVPSHLYRLYKVHQKIQENMNPMLFPVYMQKSEQKMINKYYSSKESCE